LKATSAPTVHLVAQHEQCAQCPNPDAHAAFEAGDDAAGAGRGVVERQALARRLFGMAAPAQHRARLERQRLDRRNAVEDLEQEGLAAALDFALTSVSRLRKVRDIAASTR
jgi:hypothetical protein